MVTGETFRPAYL